MQVDRARFQCLQAKLPPSSFSSSPSASSSSSSSSSFSSSSASSSSPSSSSSFSSSSSSSSLSSSSFLNRCQTLPSFNLRHYIEGLIPMVGAQREAGTSVLIEDVACEVDKLGDMTQDLIEMFQRFKYKDATVMAHALEGNLHLVFSQGFNTDEAGELLRKCSRPTLNRLLLSSSHPPPPSPPPPPPLLGY